MKVYGKIIKLSCGEGWACLSDNKDWLKRNTRSDDVKVSLPDDPNFSFVSRNYSRARDAKRSIMVLAKKAGWKVEWL